MNGLITLIVAATAGAILCASVAAADDLSPFESGREAGELTELDKPVFQRLRSLKIEPARPCSDAAFIRRVYLDVIGTLPTADEVRAFLADTQANKRAVLIDHVLQREEYADYQALKWCDLLKVKAEFPINLWPNAVQAYHRWVRTAMLENMPYDQFARQMITASGSNFRAAPANFYRAMQSREPQAIAQTVALTFMGTRFDHWSQRQRDNMAAFFANVGYKATAEWKEEIIYFDPSKTPMPQRFMLPDGKSVPASFDTDPRDLFARWLIAPENPWFARNVVNRIWYSLLGRGIVHEADDLRSDNPPSNPQLMKYLEKELVRSRYDLRHVFRLILNSRTYQLSCVPRSENPAAAGSFAYYPLRRLEAEVLVDALCGISGTTEEYSSPIPEPFTFIPTEERSIALADGSITSSFLELFGRPPRDTGLLSERNSNASAAQCLHLLNSTHVRKKLEQGPRMRDLMKSAAKDPKGGLENIYLTILSRYPTEKELLAVRDYAQSGKVGKPDAVIDLIWALVNSPEFIYRH